MYRNMLAVATLMLIAATTMAQSAPTAGQYVGTVTGDDVYVRAIPGAGYPCTKLMKGDKVKVLVGKFKGKVAKVERLIYSQDKAMLTGLEIQRKSGEKVQQGIHPSNLMIVELNLDDKKRKKSLERNKQQV